MSGRPFAEQSLTFEEIVNGSGILRGKTDASPAVDQAHDKHCISNWPFPVTRESGPKITCTMDSPFSIPESWLHRYDAINLRKIDPLRAEREIVVPEENPALGDLDQFIRVHDL